MYRCVEINIFFTYIIIFLAVINEERSLRMRSEHLSEKLFFLNPICAPNFVIVVIFIFIFIFTFTFNKTKN